jgi:hypothetical protein
MMVPVLREEVNGVEARTRVSVGTEEELLTDKETSSALGITTTPDWSR